jgi:peptidoglycan-associated lipoprotein
MSGGSAEPDPEAAREAFMHADILFAYNSFTLTDEAQQLLERKAEWMAQHPDVRIQLEGHCDERGTVAYNLALGERRANVVRQYMTALGVSDARMTTISYGEEFPLDPGHDEAAWARNRRAHFAILNP